VADRLEQLIDDRHLRRVERRLAGTIKDQPSARTGEQAKDDGMLAENVLLKDLRRVAVELEHAGVERQHVLGRHLAWRRGGLARNRRHIGRKILRARRDDAACQQHRRRQTNVVLHEMRPGCRGGAQI
jgi:hypothetical protein